MQITTHPKTTTHDVKAENESPQTEGSIPPGSTVELGKDGSTKTATPDFALVTFADEIIADAMERATRLIQAAMRHTAFEICNGAKNKDDALSAALYYQLDQPDNGTAQHPLNAILKAQAHAYLMQEVEKNFDAFRASRNERENSAK